MSGQWGGYSSSGGGWDDNGSTGATAPSSRGSSHKPSPFPNAAPDPDGPWDALLNGPPIGAPARGPMGAPSQPKLFVPGGPAVAKKPMWATKPKATGRGAAAATTPARRAASGGSSGGPSAPPLAVQVSTHPVGPPPMEPPATSPPDAPPNGGTDQQGSSTGAPTSDSKPPMSAPLMGEPSSDATSSGVPYGGAQAASVPPLRVPPSVPLDSAPHSSASVGSAQAAAPPPGTASLGVAASDGAIGPIPAVSAPGPVMAAPFAPTEVPVSVTGGPGTGTVARKKSESWQPSASRRGLSNTVPNSSDFPGIYEVGAAAAAVGGSAGVTGTPTPLLGALPGAGSSRPLPGRPAFPERPASTSLLPPPRLNRMPPPPPPSRRMTLSEQGSPAGKWPVGRGGTSLSLASHMATPLKTGGLHSLTTPRPPTAPLTGPRAPGGLATRLTPRPPPSASRAPPPPRREARRPLPPPRPQPAKAVPAAVAAAHVTSPSAAAVPATPQLSRTVPVELPRGSAPQAASLTDTPSQQYAAVAAAAAAAAPRSATEPVTDVEDRSAALNGFGSTPFAPTGPVFPPTGDVSTPFLQFRPPALQIGQSPVTLMGAAHSPSGDMAGLGIDIGLDRQASSPALAEGIGLKHTSSAALLAAYDGSHVCEGEEVRPPPRLFQTMRSPLGASRALSAGEQGLWRTSKGAGSASCKLRNSGSLLQPGTARSEGWASGFRVPTAEAVSANLAQRGSARTGAFGGSGTAAFPPSSSGAPSVESVPAESGARTAPVQFYPTSQPGSAQGIAKGSAAKAAYPEPSQYGSYTVAAAVDMPQPDNAHSAFSARSLGGFSAGSAQTGSPTRAQLPPYNAAEPLRHPAAAAAAVMFLGGAAKAAGVGLPFGAAANADDDGVAFFEHVDANVPSLTPFQNRAGPPTASAYSPAAKELFPPVASAEVGTLTRQEGQQQQQPQAGGSRAFSGHQEPGEETAYGQQQGEEPFTLIAGGYAGEQVTYDIGVDSGNRGEGQHTVRESAAWLTSAEEVTSASAGAERAQQHDSRAGDPATSGTAARAAETSAPSWHAQGDVAADVASSAAETGAGNYGTWQQQEGQGGWDYPSEQQGYAAAEAADVAYVIGAEGSGEQAYGVQPGWGHEPQQGAYGSAPAADGAVAALEGESATIDLGNWQEQGGAQPGWDQQAEQQGNEYGQQEWQGEYGVGWGADAQQQQQPQQYGAEENATYGSEQQQWPGYTEETPQGGIADGALYPDPDLAPISTGAAAGWEAPSSAPLQGGYGYGQYEYQQQPVHAPLPGGAFRQYGQPNVAAPAVASGSQAAPQTMHEALRCAHGRPACALLAFGFGGQAVLMRPHGAHGSQTTSFPTSPQRGGGGLMGERLVLEQLHVLHTAGLAAQLAEQQGQPAQGVADDVPQLLTSFPGPLSAQSSRDRLLHLIALRAEAHGQEPWCRQQDALKAMWAVLGVLVRHNGHLRSGVGGGRRDDAAPEVQLAAALMAGKLGSSYTLLTQPPPQHVLHSAAVEVQQLLLAGRQAEALRTAQASGLWGPALLLARAAGEAAFMEVASAMADRSLAAGAPLRTLLLLLAGASAAVHAPMQPGHNLGTLEGSAAVAGGSELLTEWRENLVMMAANRTKGDERVMLRLGDCLWEERGEVVAAQLCYIVAGVPLEFWDAGARLCLVGADHRKLPRSCAQVHAFQRTELYEWAMSAGHAGFGGLCGAFLGHKLAYAALLADYGRVADATRYCGAVQAALAVMPKLPPGALVAAAQAKDLAARLEAHASVRGILVGSMGGSVLGSVGRWLDRGISRLMGGDGTAASDGSASDDERRPVHRSPSRIDPSKVAVPLPSRRAASFQDLTLKPGVSPGINPGIGPPPPAAAGWGGSQYSSSRPPSGPPSFDRASATATARQPIPTTGLSSGPVSATWALPLLPQAPSPPPLGFSPAIAPPSMGSAAIAASPISRVSQVLDTDLGPANVGHSKGPALGFGSVTLEPPLSVPAPSKPAAQGLYPAYAAPQPPTHPPPLPPPHELHQEYGVVTEIGDGGGFRNTMIPTQRQEGTTVALPSRGVEEDVGGSQFGGGHWQQARQQGGDHQQNQAHNYSQEPHPSSEAVQSREKTSTFPLAAHSSFPPGDPGPPTDNTQRAEQDDSAPETAHASRAAADDPPAAATVPAPPSTMSTEVIEPVKESVEEPIREPINEPINEPKEVAKERKASIFNVFGRVSSMLTVGGSMLTGGGSGGNGAKKAKLGKQSSFFYDEKLKMWREEGSEAPPAAAPLAPPPTTAPAGVGIPGGDGPTSTGGNRFANPRTSGVNSRYVNTMSPASGGSGGGSGGGGGLAQPTFAAFAPPPMMGGGPRPMAFFIPPAPAAIPQSDELSDGGSGGGGNGGGWHSRQSSRGSAAASREPDGGRPGNGQHPSGFRAESQEQQAWQGYGAQAAPEYAQWAGAEMSAGNLEGLGSEGLAGESSASAPFVAPAGPSPGYGEGYGDAAPWAFAGADVHGSFQGLGESSGEGIGGGNNGGEPQDSLGAQEGFGLGADPWHADVAPQIVEELTEIDF